MSFLPILTSPALFYWGLGLATIPIIIHLLNRRRFRRIEWAPMKYLKLSIKRNRRRIQIEQWILLAMRVLGILLLFAAVARPKISSQGLASLLGARSRTSHVVVLDDSLSMDYRTDGKSAFDRAKKWAGSLLAALGQQDRLTFVLASQPKKPLRRSAPLTDPEEVARLSAEIDSLQPASTYVPWSATLEAVAELVETSTFPMREVTLVTDLRKAGWDRGIESVGRKWAAADVGLHIVDVGVGEGGNVALLDLESVDRIALVGSPVRWTAVVANQSGATLEGKEASFIVDGKPQAVALPKIQAGSTARIPLSATFQEAGAHHVALQLPDDSMPADNRRIAYVQVKESLNLLLVDGEPSTIVGDGETDRLGLIYEAASNGSWRLDVVPDSAWTPPPNDFSEYDLVVLANVASPTPAQADWLTRAVQAGAGLLVFSGDQVAPDAYNRLLYKDGAGLLPAAFEGTGDAEAAGLLIEDLSPSPFETVRKNERVVRDLGTIKPRRFAQVKLPENRAASGVRVLARWNDPVGSPAAVDKPFGLGRTLLWTTTADTAWSDWPNDPSFFVMAVEAAKAIARVSGGGANLTAGQDSIRLPVGAVAVDPRVEIPGGKEPLAAQLEGEAQSKTVVWDDTRHAGKYRLSWQESGRRQKEFAVNPDARESELARLQPNELTEWFAPLQPQVITAGADGSGVSSVRDQEIWRTLVGALLVLVALEAAFATWTGRQR